ncbi:hypothetical protein CEXT_129631 [Caerostris extrusa]|uniref:Uncharacterized protein n=1 Tax=Caerostris extrusa TaxID=172846 RepID=A0AAV4N1A0_CAEEX|nr:hypothetical protein CEXT_129631 [Caerostris extrusa]
MPLGKKALPERKSNSKPTHPEDFFFLDDMVFVPQSQKRSALCIFCYSTSRPRASEAGTNEPNNNQTLENKNEILVLCTRQLDNKQQQHAVQY